MYQEYFGLKENPFSVTSDPSYLFMSRVHKEAFSSLLYGIKEKKGFLTMTGEIGAGKTTLCKALLNGLDKSAKSAFIFNSTLPELQLLRGIVEDFGLPVKRKSKYSMIRQLNSFLIEELTKGNDVVLIIDEAQNLKPKTLEEIRLLSNLETEKEKLFQIILVGQVELEDKLNTPELRQLKQRVAVKFHITPLAIDEVEQYIYHRMKIAGANGNTKFTADAIEMIHKFSSGVPRLINDKTLLVAYVLESRKITRPMVERSIREIEGLAS
ncbi:ExeA family protein [Candidatus Omnitrophota bacterium]